MRGSVLGFVMGVLPCLAPAEAGAGGAGQGGLALDCRLPEEAGALTADMLCTAMTASLEQSAPGLRITGRDGRAALMLVVQVTGADARGLRGHLWWDRAQDADPQSGPEVRFRLVDAALDAGKLQGFTDALLASEPGLAPALKAALD
ncbi:hypothetical protein [Pacificoceanicola onchidii]|uniref:hypothetical protein n=1 Tax=Pacificoceanicola onchidii TaxID=2562685 RepID=UPI0010A5F297|nr:hypothetical protein [Pacificoceanicola onchidii]